MDALAALVGTSKASLSRIETRDQIPSLGLVKRIVGVSEGELSANDFVEDAALETNEARA